MKKEVSLGDLFDPFEKPNFEIKDPIEEKKEKEEDDEPQEEDFEFDGMFPATYMADISFC